MARFSGRFTSPKEISGQVEKRLAEGFEKTTETFTQVLTHLTRIDEAQKILDELGGIGAADVEAAQRRDVDQADVFAAVPHLRRDPLGGSAEQAPFSGPRTDRPVWTNRFGERRCP